MTWTFFPAKDAFEEHRSQWDRVNALAGNHPLLDSAFVGPLVRYFASARTLLAVSTAADYPGMALLEPGRAGFWSTFQPSQAPLGLIVLPRRDDIEHQLKQLLGALPGWALGLAVLQQDPDWSALSALAPSDTVEPLAHMETPRLTITTSFADYWRARSKNLRENLSRRRRRLKQAGVLTELRTVRDAADIPECIRHYARLEEGGWKGRVGTAVHAEGAQGLFYSDALRAFCAKHEGIVFELLANGAPIASELWLERGGVLLRLKKTYDEHMKEYSPGLLLHEDILRVAFAWGDVRVLEFYGRARDFHRQWTNEFRTIFHVNLFRNGAVSRARRLLKSLRATRGAAGA